MTTIYSTEPVLISAEPKPSVKKSQKHYTSRLMILEDIHKAQRKKLKLDQQAEVENITAIEKQKADDPLYERHLEARDECSAAALRLETRLKKLNATMAVFMTPTLNGVETDGVVLQNVG